MRGRERCRFCGRNSRASRASKCNNIFRHFSETKFKLRVNVIQITKAEKFLLGEVKVDIIAKK